VWSIHLKAAEYTARQHNMEFYRQRLIFSFHRVLPNQVSLQVVNRTFANMAMSSLSEKYISPRGFNQMKTIVSDV
jgi:hypothetical protein